MRPISLYEVWLLNNETGYEKRFSYENYFTFVVQVFGAAARGATRLKIFNKHHVAAEVIFSYFFLFRFFFPSNFSYTLFPRVPSASPARPRSSSSSSTTLRVAATEEAMADDDTSGMRRTRKRQNYTLNIYDEPNPLSTLKTLRQPFLSVYTIKTRSQQDALGIAVITRIGGIYE